MSVSRKTGTRLFAVALALVMTVGLFVQPAAARQAEGGYAGEDLVSWFDPDAAQAIQDRIDGVEPESFGDLDVVLYTVALPPLGARYFDGDYALPDDPDELVDIVVQFVTPPQEVLRMMDAADHPYMEEAEGGIRAFGAPCYETMALDAHDAFEAQLADLLPGGVRRLAAAPALDVLDMQHILFNGAVMTVPAGMVETIAALPEVFLVTPNFRMFLLSECPQEEMAEHEAFLEQLETFAEIAAYYAENEEPAAAEDEEEEEEDDDEPAGPQPADPADWVPGSNSWSRGFNREARELFRVDYINTELGITGSGVRVAIVDSGLDYTHPRYIPFYYPNQVMRGGPNAPRGYRVPGSGGANIHTPAEPMFNGGWGDGENHGTHVAGSIIGMAPGVNLFGYRGLSGTGWTWGTGGVWNMMTALTRFWNDGLNPNGTKRYTRNIVNYSMGSMNQSPFNNNSYVQNVMTLTGYYLIVAGSANNGPEYFSMMTPTNAGLVLTVGAGRAGGFTSPFIFEDATLNGEPLRADIMAWDWAWMPLDANGWREAFPVEMPEIMQDVFDRPVIPRATLNAQNVPSWRRGNGLNRDEYGNAQFVWVGALADSDAARTAAVNRLVALGIDVSGMVVIQARNGAGSPGQNNPRNFWAQQGAGALIIVDDRPSLTEFSYAGGSGVNELIQGSIPMLSMPAEFGRRLLPSPAGIPPNSPLGYPAIPVTTNATTANANITGVTGTINLGALTDHSVRDAYGNYQTQSNFAPDYLAVFSSRGPQRHSYHVGISLVAPGVHVHSTHPAHSTNRWGRSHRNAAGDFTNAAGDPIAPAGNPVPVYTQAGFGMNWTPDWSISYALAMGTSMSGPTAAGMAALVWEAFPDNSPQEIRARLMNTATVMGSENRPDPYNVFQVGAGRINPLAAIQQQAVATAETTILWHFHPNFPDPVNGNLPGPGAAPPTNWLHAALGGVTDGALNFGAVAGERSQEITVTINYTDGVEWNLDEIRFNTADPARDAMPVAHFHEDVSLELVRYDNEGEEQTFTFVMNFPAHVPYGMYNGNVIFTSAEGGHITMPFAGVPYNAPNVGLHANSGINRPILTSFVPAPNQPDIRHITGTGLTNSNRSSVHVGLVIPWVLPQHNIANNWRRIDLYARPVIDGELGDQIYYFATAQINPNGAAASLWQQVLTTRIPDPANPGQNIDLPEGVYELFIGIQLMPPELIGGSLVRGNVASHSMGNFVVSNTQPTIEDLAAVPTGVGAGLTITGRVNSLGHNLALEHGVRTNRIATGTGISAPVPFTYAHAQVFVGNQNVRPNADGTFSMTVANPPAVPFRIGAIDAMWNDHNAATGTAVSLRGSLVSVNEPTQVRLNISNIPAVARRNVPITLNAFAEPVNLVPADLIWTSSNPAIAPVGRYTGVLTPRGMGMVIITVQSACGSARASFTVRVA